MNDTKKIEPVTSHANHHVECCFIIHCIGDGHFIDFHISKL